VRLFLRGDPGPSDPLILVSDQRGVTFFSSIPFLACSAALQILRARQEQVRSSLAKK
jgi:C4-dicarboxylate-specific signal transduction histidine kinase